MCQLIKNPNSDTDPGISTQDKVFLLSILETEKYFLSDSDLSCSSTKYAYEQGAYINKDGNCRWWLRSPGFNMSYAAYVNDKGSVLGSGSELDKNDIAVRPAIWVDFGY